MHYGFRTCDPASARWLSPDPAGALGSAHTPLNIYQMVDANPTTLRDRYGLLTLHDIQAFLRHQQFGNNQSKLPIDVLQTIQAFSEYRNAPLRFTLDKNNDILAQDEVSGSYNAQLLHRALLNLWPNHQKSLPIAIARIILRYMPAAQEYSNAIRARPRDLRHLGGPLLSTRDDLERLLFKNFRLSEYTGHGLYFSRFYVHLIKTSMLDAHKGFAFVFLKDLATPFGGAKLGDQLKKLQILESYYEYRLNRTVRTPQQSRRALANKVNTDIRLAFHPFVTRNTTNKNQVWKHVYEAFRQVQAELQYLSLRDLHDHQISHGESARELVLSVFAQEQAMLRYRFASDRFSRLSSLQKKRRLRPIRPQTKKRYRPLTIGQNIRRKKDLPNSVLPNLFTFLVQSVENYLLPYSGPSRLELDRMGRRVSLKPNPEYVFRQPIFHKEILPAEGQGLMLNMYPQFWRAMMNGAYGIGRRSILGSHHLPLKNGGAFSYTYFVWSDRFLQPVIFDFARKRVKEYGDNGRVLNRWVLSGQSTHLAPPLPFELKRQAIVPHALGKNRSPGKNRRKA